MAGTLFVVSTPIGNLGDVTERARETLAAVELIACEDTRVTRKLLTRLDVHTKTLSYHEHNERERTPQIITRLERGEDVALVSDAGTPTVSDPGYRLVRAARDKGIAVRAVPGASALLAALAVSGLPTSSFTFVGFLPARGGARRKALASLAALPHTIVLFEAPTRIGRLLAELSETLGAARPACLLRELTKLHEEHRSATLDELASWAAGRSFRGELTLVIGGPARTQVETRPLENLAPRFEELRAQGLSPRDAVKAVAKESGLPTRRVYNELVVKRGER